MVKTYYWNRDFILITTFLGEIQALSKSVGYYEKQVVYLAKKKKSVIFSQQYFKAYHIL